MKQARPWSLITNFGCSETIKDEASRTPTKDEDILFIRAVSPLMLDNHYLYKRFVRVTNDAGEDWLYLKTPESPDQSMFVKWASPSRRKISPGYAIRINKHGHYEQWVETHLGQLHAVKTEE